MTKPLFQVIFKDGTNYVGNKSYRETGWLQIPFKKPIKRLFYLLPSEDYLCLDGYTNYFRMSEAVKVLTGKSRGQDILKYDYIMALKNGIITSYRITLLSNGEDKEGDIKVRTFKLDDKFIKGLNKDNFRPLIGVK